MPLDDIYCYVNPLWQKPKKVTKNPDRFTQILTNKFEGEPCIECKTEPRHKTGKGRVLTRCIKCSREHSRKRYDKYYRS